MTSLTLPVLPLGTGVLLPEMFVTIALETTEAKAAADAAGEDGHVLVVPKVGTAYASVGTVAHIEERGDLPGGRAQAILVRGLYRAKIGVGVPGSGDALWVNATRAEELNVDTERAHELAREYKAVVSNILESRGLGGLIQAVRDTSAPSAVADLAGYSADLSVDQKIQVLEALAVDARLELVVGWAKEILAEQSIRESIRRDVNEGMEKTQRDYLLRQQLAAIKKELGDDGLGDDDLSRLEAIVDDGLVPEQVRKAVERELGRLERTSEQSPEHGWIRTWLDTVADIPWTQRAEDQLDVGEARRVLDADHNGLDDVKDRIVEHLAIRKRRSDRGLALVGERGAGAIITLVGPPGVGKTSLGESVARAMGRPFVRVALGGVRDEAEIRGHRRTYVGAMPGRIARAVKEAGVMNPVVMLDEVDKLGADWRGDPSSALLEVLDPAQNHTFRDHYLEVDLDLSDVLFIVTANVVETIPGPLLDRMEIVRLDGYTEDEKVQIARDHLLARQLERNALDASEVTVGDDALRVVVGDYTREAGVRNLEREIGKLLRKAATAISNGASAAPVVVDGAAAVRTWLGRPKFFFEAPERTSVPGVATGLAVTGVGGDVLFVEATVMDGSSDGGLTLTGQLGDVMKESASIALSYVRSHAAALGIDPEAFAGKRFHVHVPAGAVPKDGPSAGVTMTTALVSLLTDRPVRGVLGMTGEVTLQGKVLPIGGVKQKVLAAHRAGLTEVVLPARNGPDLEDVPVAVRDAMTFHLASEIGEVLAVALETTDARVTAAA
ncbi:MAG TPA: endopeptidase La [Acidimicrobiales bacterium]|nr:endopeptidase La [Acidimicrobiales bacterium]